MRLHWLIATVALLAVGIGSTGWDIRYWLHGYGVANALEGVHSAVRVGLLAVLALVTIAAVLWMLRRLTAGRRTAKR